jgi:hypothetical protein
VTDLRCSFCKKSQNDVRKLIAGPSVYICDECIEVCQDIIDDDTRLDGAAQVPDQQPAKTIPDRAFSGLALTCSLCRMPVPVDDGLLIESRGALCPGCIAAIQAAVAQREAVE